jgi:hypothetical protein
MSNARALAYANIMTGTSVRETTGTSHGTLGGFDVNSLEYRLNINGNPVRPDEILSSSTGQVQTYMSSIFIEELQEVMNMVVPSSIGHSLETAALLEVAVIRTEAFVPVVNYNTTNHGYDIYIPGYVGTAPHYDDGSYYL